MLCHIEAGGGWPVAAVVNDDTLKANEFFDGPASLGDVGRIRFAVRAATKEALAELTRPPESALASLRVEWEAPKVRGCEPCCIEGWVWLPDVWPVEPKLRVMRHDQSSD